jgi:hypothetical protein
LTKKKRIRGFSIYFQLHYNYIHAISLFIFFHRSYVEAIVKASLLLSPSGDPPASLPPSLRSAWLDLTDRHAPSLPPFARVSVYIALEKLVPVMAWAPVLARKVLSDICGLLRGADPLFPDLGFGITDGLPSPLLILFNKITGQDELRRQAARDPVARRRLHFAIFDLCLEAYDPSKQLAYLQKETTKSVRHIYTISNVMAKDKKETKKERKKRKNIGRCDLPAPPGLVPPAPPLFLLGRARAHSFFLALFLIL